MKDVDDTPQEEEQSQPLYTIDFDNLPTIKHVWVDRGLKLTCEAGTHQPHEVWKRRTT